MNTNTRLATIGLVAGLALSGCSTLGASVTTPNSESSSSQSSENTSSSASGDSALADCQAYQSGYNSMRFSDFLETEWNAFQSGASTKFKSQEFLDLWTTVQNGNFPTWDDVGYVVYELCWDVADFEITIPVVEQLPTASTVKEAMVVALAYYCESINPNTLETSNWSLVHPVAIDGFYLLSTIFLSKGVALYDIDVRNEGYSLITPNDSLAQDSLEAWGCTWPMKVLAAN